jgi:hypothetical protein
MPDSSLNVTEVMWQGPEYIPLYLGSPSVLKLPSGVILASHDFFGAAFPAKAVRNATVFSSPDNGATWKRAGVAAPMYWATLFNRPADAASLTYIMGTSSDTGDAQCQVVISSSADEGLTWAAGVKLTTSSPGYSTGPTPVLLHAGRLWRAYEQNTGAWASGYSTVVISAAADAASLLAPSAWTLSQPVPFSVVAGLVPASWAVQGVTPAYGWLEGNAVAPPNDSDAGIYIMLRVNSQVSMIISTEFMLIRIVFIAADR